MSYDPLISAARREAKSRSRITGASYQSTLEDVARQAGADSWAAFIASPVAIKTDSVAAKHQGGSTPVGWRMPAAFTALALLMVAATSFLNGLDAAHAVNAVGQTMLDMNTDQVRSTAVRFAGHTRDMPVTALAREDSGMRLTVMAIDNRPFPLAERRASQYIAVGLADGVEAGRMLVHHPVARISGHLDCATGAFRPKRLEMADRYRGPAAYRHVMPGRRAWTLPSATTARLCHVDGDGDLTDRIPVA